MTAQLVPIIKELRQIYDLAAPMDRYNKYVSIMIDEHREILPLGDFSPMGQRQKTFMTKLLQMDAEQRVAEIVATVAMPTAMRAMLVVVDEPKNGWTQRYLTDFEWRLNTIHPSKVKGGDPIDPRPWVPIYLWTVDDELNDLDINQSYLKLQTISALHRAAWQQQHGKTESLQEFINQEGHALKAAGWQHDLSEAEIEHTQYTLKAHLDSSDYATIFSAMYGDIAATAVGYAPLQIPTNGGFALSITI